MTYPPQGGYPDDPNNYGPDAQSPFGYPDQPASPPSSPAPYTPPPGGGWPDTAQTNYGPPQPPPPGPMPGTAPPPGGMGGPPPGGFVPPPPPPKSNNATIGWIVGGIAAVVLILAGIGAVIFFTSTAGSDDSADGTVDSTSQEPDEPSRTPTDVVNAYYDAIRSHDVDAAYKTLCAAMQGSESEFFGSFDEQQFWDTVDASTYTVGQETKPDEQTAKVDIQQEIQGETYDFYAELKLESDEWKICYWSSPV